MFEVHNEEKKVEYLELVYDLIFVYLIGRNSSLIQHVDHGFVRSDLFLTYILCTLIIIQIWNYTTFYINRYGSNGLVEHIGIFVNMYLLYYMADGTRVDWHEYYYRYNVAWFLIIMNIVVLYLHTMRRKSKDAPWEIVQIKGTVTMLLIQAGIILLSLPVYALTGIPLSPCAMIFGIIATLFMGRINRLVAVDFAHLSERAMLYVVFTFGEMIIAISGYFHGGFGFNTIYFSVMAFLIVVALFLSYGLMYDKLIDREMSTNGTGYMMIHVFLIFALSNITVALEFMRETEIDILPKTIFMISSLLLYYTALIATERYGKERMKLTKKCFLTIAAEFIVFALLMYLFRRQMYINIAVTVIFVFMLLGYLFSFWRGVVREED